MGGMAPIKTNEEQERQILEYGVKGKSIEDMEQELARESVNLENMKKNDADKIRSDSLFGNLFQGTQRRVKFLEGRIKTAKAAQLMETSAERPGRKATLLTDPTQVGINRKTVL